MSMPIKCSTADSERLPGRSAEFSTDKEIASGESERQATSGKGSISN